MQITEGFLVNQGESVVGYIDMSQPFAFPYINW